MAKILIIGEYANIRTLLAEDLAGEGHIVAVTGTPALIGETLMSLEPDVILLDFRLNRIDQWWVLDEVKRQAPHLSVVPFTSYISSEENGGNSEAATRYLDTLKKKVTGILTEKAWQRLRWIRPEPVSQKGELGI